MYILALVNSSDCTLHIGAVFNNPQLGTSLQYPGDQELKQTNASLNARHVTANGQANEHYFVRSLLQKAPGQLKRKKMIQSLICCPQQISAVNTVNSLKIWMEKKKKKKKTCLILLLYVLSENSSPQHQCRPQPRAERKTSVLGVLKYSTLVMMLRVLCW